MKTIEFWHSGNCDKSGFFEFTPTIAAAATQAGFYIQSAVALKTGLISMATEHIHNATFGLF